MSQDVDGNVFIFLALLYSAFFLTALFTNNDKLSDRAYEWSILFGVLMFSFPLLSVSSTENWFNKLTLIAFVYFFGFFRGIVK